MKNDYGSSSVEEAILNLQSALMINYMRTGLKIHLEPDAFYRLMNELAAKDIRSNISKEVYLSHEIRLNGPMGPLTIVKDGTLGDNTYVRMSK